MASLKMTCINPKNMFCFVCGVYTKSHHKRSIMTKPLIDAYEAYFECRTIKRNYAHGPPSVCNDCNNALLRWSNGMTLRPELSFDVPMIWSEPSNHQTDCYFCMTTSMGRRGSMAYLDEPVKYPDNLLSAIKPRMTSLKAINTSIVARRGRSMGAVMTAPAVSKRASSMVNGLDNKQVPVGTAQTGTRQVAKQTRQVLIAGLKRKSSDPPDANMYDVTKVRLHSLEPSVVLEQSEKRLPSSSRTSAGLRSQTTTSSTKQQQQLGNPQITSVFSLQSEIPEYDDFTSTSPTALMRAVNGHVNMPITIEIEDDDDEEEEGEQEITQEIGKPELPELKKEQETNGTQQDREQDAQFSLEQLGEAEEHKPLKAAEFINIHSLPSASSTASSKMVVVKMVSPQKLPTRSSSSGPSDSAGPAATSTTNPSIPNTPVRPARPPHLITQSELILLIRELELSREKSAILIERLKQWNLLAAQLITPNRQRAGVSAPVTQPAQPVVQHVTTLSGMSTMRNITIKREGMRNLAVPKPTTMPFKRTVVQQPGGQSFIRLTPTSGHSNTITTSNRRKLTLPHGIPALQQQVVVRKRSPVKSELVSSS
ncbi:AGAP005629-PA-like protein [Anopheles sinensis]|uniref:AGAP005629-PA-like protein n=1 Tax=Anopheles sinensis TaxID=74873 RepID=A0A084W9Z3_ANOSI|nr:AGAP005629-PA-like protein [Anopheles sinensis]